MKRNDVLAILRAHRDDLRVMGVCSLALFGSTVRGEAGPHSDVDLLVKFDDPVGIFEFLEVKEYLEEILKCPVDLVPHNGIKKQLRDEILAEAIDAA